MRLIGFAVILAFGLTLAPLAAEAQPTPARLAMLLMGPRADSTPEYVAFMAGPDDVVFDISHTGWQTVPDREEEPQSLLLRADHVIQ